MPDDRFQLIVGLGNPGSAYRGTRHNAGFLVVDRLAGKHGILLNQKRFKTALGVGSIEGRGVILAKPLTFMNLSGPAVRNLFHVFSLDMKHLLVIHDDIDLVFGQIKIKQKGGDGGHKGVKSLIEAMGSGKFARLRIGIGRPKAGQATEEYVLARFDAQEGKRLQELVSSAQDAVETILVKGALEAMNRFHGKTISESNVGRKI
jgi:PTH1 family peptidyl-tRNA hydrolase